MDAKGGGNKNPNPEQGNQRREYFQVYKQKHPLEAPRESCLWSSLAQIIRWSPACHVVHSWNKESILSATNVYKAELEETECFLIVVDLIRIF